MDDIDGGHCALSSILSIGVGGVGIFSLSIDYTLVSPRSMEGVLPA